MGFCSGKAALFVTSSGHCRPPKAETRLDVGMVARQLWKASFSRRGWSPYAGSQAEGYTLPRGARTDANPTA